MLQKVKLKAKKQLGNLFAKENDGLSRGTKSLLVGCEHKSIISRCDI